VLSAETGAGSEGAAFAGNSADKTSLAFVLLRRVARRFGIEARGWREPRPRGAQTPIGAEHSAAVTKRLG